jgi:hypothetical protein
MPGPTLAKLEGATTVSCRWGRGRSDGDELAPLTTLLFFPAGCAPMLPHRDPLLGRCTPLLPKLFGTVRTHSSLSWGCALMRPLLSFLLAPWRLPLFCVGWGDKGQRCTSYQTLSSPQSEQSFLPKWHISFINSRVDLLLCGIGGTDLKKIEVEQSQTDDSYQDSGLAYIYWHTL